MPSPQLKTSFLHVLLLALLMPPAVVGQDLAICSELLQEAESTYVDGRFDRTIQLADECLGRREAGLEERTASYRLLALAYIKMERLGDARMTVLQLLNENPGYMADPVSDPPDYAAVVESVKAQFRPADEPTRERSWFASNSNWLIGTGAAFVGGVLAAVLLQGGGSGAGGSDLPAPPEMPH